MRNFLRRIIFNNKSLWIISISISLILFAIVLSQLDIQLLRHSVTQELKLYLLLIAIILLILEGIMTALRILVFASGTHKFHSALYANAWYVFFLIFLPARLGEVAAVYILQKYMHQSRGASVMSIILQRLLDLIILATIFIILITLMTDVFSTNTSVIISISFILFLSIIYIFRLEFISYAAIQFSHISNVRRKPILRAIYRTLLQARLWNKQFKNSKKLPKLILITILKWLANLAAITLIFLSINSTLRLSDSLIISVLYNFLAVIPIQTIGGIGISEAGLTALFLNLANLSIASAVAISIFTRLIIILFPFLFFLLAFTYNKYQSTNPKKYC